ncbi:MAG: bifunctional phosphoglucose/phosphomannose isomerase, partial [Chloroflexota bacterium]|nr:bifunctional phosphoglucose/phosphomannose isomerase [Chloroflexota bacterium]
MAIINLDKERAYQQFDISGMRKHLHEFPKQCQRAWQMVSQFELPPEYSKVNKVLIAGMGGSAVGGEIVRRLALCESKSPVWVHQDYGLPPFVDENMLVIISSYSGNTEETISAFTELCKTNAKKLVVTTGGKLGNLARKEGIPVFTIDYQAPPRAAFPHSFIPLLGIFQKLGLLTEKSADLEEAIQILNKLSAKLTETIPLASNPAKQLATRLYGRVSVIYGAEILSEVARRWKTQINENGKSWAFFELFPEVNHNAAVGYEFPSQVKEKMFVILLRSTMFHPRILLRYEATAKLLDKIGIQHSFVEATGKSALAQMMSLILFGDYVSFYLAILNGADPTPVVSIDFVKGYLSRF